MNYLEGSTFPIFPEYQNNPEKEKGYVDMMYDYIKENMLLDIKSATLIPENVIEDELKIDEKKFKFFSADIKEKDKLIGFQSFYISAVNQGVVFLKTRSTDEKFKKDIQKSISNAKIIN